MIICKHIRLFVNIHTNILIFIGIFIFYLLISFVRNKADILSQEAFDLFLSVAGINHTTGEGESYITCNLPYTATEDSVPVDSSG